MRKILLTLFALTISMSFNTSAFAQDTKVEDKKALIHQFRKLTGADKVNLSLNISTDIREDFQAQMAEDKNLTEAQKQELNASINGANERIDKVAKGFLDDKETISKLSEDVIIQIYDKTFTEAELKELIAFYKTPTGQKAAAFLPTLSKQTEQAFGQEMIARLQALVGPQIDKEKAQFQQKLKELSNKAQPEK